MTARRQEQKRVEAVALGTRLLLVLEFIEGVQDFPSGPHFRAVVQESVQAGNLRGLKLIARDVDEMMLTLAPHEQEGLAAILRARLSVDTDEEWASLEKDMMGVVSKGRIASEKERQRLERFVEVLEARAAPASQVSAVRALLAKPNP